MFMVKYSEICHYAKSDHRPSQASVKSLDSRLKLRPESFGKIATRETVAGVTEGLERVMGSASEFHAMSPKITALTLPVS
jgi:hypothetical protein